MKNFRQILPYLKSCRREFILAVLFVTAETAFELFIPLVMSNIIDLGIAAKDISYILRQGILMAVCALLSLVCGLLYARYAAMAALGFGTSIREAEYEKLQDYSFANLDHFETSSLITRMTTDITVLQNAIINGLRPMIRGPVMLVMGLGLAFFMNVRLALVFLVCMPVLGCVLFLIVRKVAPMYGKLQKSVDKVNNVVQENLNAIRAVKAYVRGTYEEENFGRANPDSHREQPQYVPDRRSESPCLPVHHVHRHRSDSLVWRQSDPQRRHGGGRSDWLSQLCHADRQFPDDDLQRVSDADALSGQRRADQRSVCRAAGSRRLSRRRQPGWKTAM